MDRMQFLEQFTSEIKYMGFEQIGEILLFHKEGVFNFKDAIIRIHPEMKEISFTGRLFLNDEEYRNRIIYSFYEFVGVQEELRMNTLGVVTFIFKELCKEALYNITE